LYGFNGKENDKDISEGGQDYGMRIYDSRLGRFLTVDPIAKQYPELTPYQFASNSPIANVDLDGLEKAYYTITIQTTITFIQTTDSKGIIYKTECPHTSTKIIITAKEPFFNGSLGTGVLIKVQHQNVFKTVDANGKILEIKEHTPRVNNLEYFCSESDQELMYKIINRPIAQGSVGLIIFGEGNGIYPDDDLGSRANSNMQLYSISFTEFTEIMDPILNSLSGFKKPKIYDPRNSKKIDIEKTLKKLDEYAAKEFEKKSKKNPQIIPSESGITLVPNSSKPNDVVHRDKNGNINSKLKGNGSFGLSTSPGGSGKPDTATHY
jgi:RHS repeat-associated protein